ncbi:MAG: RluA family pseudouridine synthase [Clostridia bacterium]|nr:RluA family pseudouridine synthase [Clostridia bacterium]
MHELKIGKNDAGQRLDKFLTKALPSLPLSLLYKSVRTKKIKVNRHRADIKQILAEGDTLQLFLSDDFFQDGKEGAASLDKISVKLDLLYEDAAILLVNKRPGISVHEDENGDANTLLLQIQAYLYQKGEYDPDREQSFAPALCNRIDRNTGGIVIAAKTAEALRDMNARIKARRLGKYYLCVVKGHPKVKEALLSGFLRKDAKSNTVTVYDKNPPRDAKEIKTRYRVLRTNGAYSLLEVELLTGRTHQIRAHLAHAGFPLLGDGKYGENKADRSLGYKYQALWSYRLIFTKGGEPDSLSYLDGREFAVPFEKIYFIKELFEGLGTDTKPKGRKEQE